MKKSKEATAFVVDDSLKEKSEQRYLSPLLDITLSILFSILVITLLSFCIVIIQNIIQHNDQMKEIQELKILIQERAVKDTLYWNHLENCAFIQKDSIGVGYQSYLYSKYHRKYKINDER
jgi:hypothetical protein